MNILITGGVGYIGSYTIKRLVATLKEIYVDDFKMRIWVLFVLIY
jgi:nucleoside-diphosphate-sugar epimerase